MGWGRELDRKEEKIHEENGHEGFRALRLDDLEAFSDTPAQKLVEQVKADKE